MKCTIAGCPGEYEDRKITHTVRLRGQLVVIDHVPAEVCFVCGDVLLKPSTLRGLESMLDHLPASDATVPLYEYA